MKSTIITVATAATVIMSSISATADVRSAIGGASNASSRASADISASMKDAASSIIDGSVKISNTASDDISSILKVSGNLVMSGFDISKEGTTLVLCSAKSASNKASDLANGTSDAMISGTKKAITTSGRIITSTVVLSQKGMNLSVTLASNVIDATGDALVSVYNSSKDMLIGSVRVSKNTAADLMDASKRGTEITIDKTGNLIQGGSQVIGQVVDASGKAVSFVSDKAGDLLILAKDTSVVVIHSAAHSMKSLVQTLADFAKNASHATSTVVKTSLRGSVMLLKASGRSIVVIADDIERMTHAKK